MGLEGSRETPLVLGPPPHDNASREQRSGDGEPGTVDPPMRARSGFHPLVVRGRYRTALNGDGPSRGHCKGGSSDAASADGIGDLRSQDGGVESDASADNVNTVMRDQRDGSREGEVPAIPGAAKVSNQIRVQVVGNNWA